MQDKSWTSFGCCFFFDEYIEFLKANPNNKYFFNPVVPIAGNSSESEAISKAIAENKRVWARSGFRTIYTRLIKERYYMNIEDIMEEKFDKIVHILSLDGSL